MRVAQVLVDYLLRVLEELVFVEGDGVVFDLLELDEFELEQGLLELEELGVEIGV